MGISVRQYLLSVLPGVLVQREDEVEKLMEERRFRPAGGDLKGMRVYGSDAPGRHAARGFLGCDPKTPKLGRSGSPVTGADLSRGERLQNSKCGCAASVPKSGRSAVSNVDPFPSEFI